ncbi:hypothetical protein VTK26DRAFT_4576 [Humicola hyalothermophila]
MPSTRRSSRAAAASSPAGAGRQSTLSFKNRVTKSIRTSGGKDADYKSPARTKEFKRSPTPPPERDREESEPSEEKALARPAAAAAAQAQAQAQEDEAKESELGPESRARKISDRAIEKYWGEIEASRQARAVHRKHGEGLSTGEKVLRYFDVSSQYGPCLGITRIKRWQRAERLGLHPPIEVLAVLLKEEAKGNKGIEKAHMDELLNSTAIGSVGV